MPERLYFTDSDESNALIAEDPFALLVGFALDQQVTVQKAFAGPLALKERLGGRLDPATVAAADLEPIFRERPAIHRFPGAMAKRVHDLAVHLVEHYDGEAARVWEGASPEQLRANLAGLPGFGTMKIKSMGSVLAKHYGVAAAEPLVPWHPTLGDVDSAQALADYQATKRANKASWSA
jgi:uncharacterized HhH-GPD family protein